MSKLPYPGVEFAAESTILERKEEVCWFMKKKRGGRKQGVVDSG